MNYLDFYLDLTLPPEFAVLIRGEWGCGKSWFIRDFIKKRKTKHDFLFISLYGTSSFKDIEDAFFEQTHPVLASKGMKLAGKVLKGVLKTTIKVDLDGDGNAGGTIRSEIPTISLPDFLKNVDKKVLIFDDLERSNIEISNLLGYINQFVESNGSKVILIANEKELVNNDISNCKYSKIKEKIIGKSFTINPSIDSAFTSFASSANNENLKNILKTQQGVFINTFNKSQYNNLRHLKQSLLDLDRLFDLLPDISLKKPELLIDLITIFLAISFEIKNGHLIEDDVAKHFSLEYSFQKNNEKSLHSKYSMPNFHTPPINGLLIEKFIKFGHLSKSEVKESIENSIYFQDENTPAWKKLWSFYELDDKDFETYVSEVIEDLDNNRIEDVFVLLHVFGIFTKLFKYGLTDIAPNQLFEAASNNVQNLKEKGKLFGKVLDSLTSEAAFNMGYHEREDSNFLKLIAFIKKNIIESNHSKLPKIADSLITQMREAPKEFKENITLGNSNNNIYYDIPVLLNIDPDDFISILLNQKSQEKRLVCLAIKERYGHSMMNEELIGEIDWLKKILKKLKSRLNDIEGSISKFTIEKIGIPIFEEAIQTLESCKRKKKAN